MSAWLGEHKIAQSDDIVMVEGNAYFPIGSVRSGVLTPTASKSLCLWKGIASYFDVMVEGAALKNAAFEYRRPSPLARRIKGRVAFWNGVTVRRD
ncbi:DUF427 domain-containing protein [Rhodococcus sp. IEGM 1318]|uniref:DUF427 domain-containing protein n=1 Tax=Rhodococcus sp. IEGM 1318 TaxID=3082226 RepID=UPI0029534CF4|nr:DUF427 domain-containing protein [Rhodococcus sp. IEGM 1318]MDV8009182.1 DUF427 domain-containing protein [Rhodococcus sp. IEGM 1318]